MQKAFNSSCQTLWELFIFYFGQWWTLITLLLPLSTSHVGRQVLQRRGGERQGLAEGGQALPAAVSQHRALLQCGADG